MMGKDFPAPYTSEKSHYVFGVRLDQAGYGATSQQLHPGLLDPVFGDMDYTSRGYLLHFATTLSADMVISSTDNPNPFRSLIPLAREHPILLHAIVATSALHTSGLHRRASRDTHLDTFFPPQSQRAPQISIDARSPSAIAKIDALVAKQKALVLLRDSLQQIQHLQTANLKSDSRPDVDIDLVITVIHLFITFDLIDMDDCQWRAHVEGAMRLIGSLQTLSHRNKWRSASSPLEGVRDAITSDCLTYYILGSTLLTTPKLDNPFRLSTAENANADPDTDSESQINLTSSLIRAESNSYLSLPTPLLQILFKACELSNLASVVISNPEDPSVSASTSGSAGESIHTAAQTLLEEACSLDVASWAARLEHRSPARQQSRIHTALAHRSAVMIYIIRSVEGLPYTTTTSTSSCSSTSSSSSTTTTTHPQQEVDETLSSLVHSIVSHLSHIGPADPMFKATCWPTFIAGAETDDPVYRAWAVERLRGFWWLIPWGYLPTAVEVMRTSWGMRERGRDGVGVCARGNAGRGWIQGLKALGPGWLIP
ncbi:fungal-specific transcription factor domain-containing protein [Aspergillus heterothallicus]